MKGTRHSININLFVWLLVLFIVTDDDVESVFLNFPNYSNFPEILSFKNNGKSLQQSQIENFNLNANLIK